MNNLIRLYVDVDDLCLLIERIKTDGLDDYEVAVYDHLDNLVSLAYDVNLSQTIGLTEAEMNFIKENTSHD